MGKRLPDEKLYDKAKEEMRFFERILAEIPGFRGYKEKELRRETDKIIRRHAYQRLRATRDDLKRVFQKLSDQRLHEVLGEMDRLIMNFDRVAEKINHASYGYAGFFNVLKIEEEKLDKMIAFDSNLINYVGRIVEEANAFKKEATEGHFERDSAQIENLKALLDSLEEVFDSREEVILEG